MWNGWTPTDLVFPFLLFAMGAAVPFALSRRRGTRLPVHAHVLRRAAVLFALGLVLNAIEIAAAADVGDVPDSGVLQRIAIVYLAVALLTEHTRAYAGRRSGAASPATGRLLRLVPVPGAGAGLLTPDRQPSVVHRSRGLRPCTC